MFSALRPCIVSPLCIVCPLPAIRLKKRAQGHMCMGSPQPGAIRSASRPMPWSLPAEGRRSGACAENQSRWGESPFAAAACRRPFAPAARSQGNFNGARSGPASGRRTNRARLLSRQRDDIHTRRDADGRANRDGHCGKRRCGRGLDRKRRFAIGRASDRSDQRFGMASRSVEIRGVKRANPFELS
jgi:hypothetical protein